EAGAPPSRRIIEDMGQYVQGAIKAGGFEDGAGLHPSSRRARLVFDGGKRTVVRGPYAGSNELLAGFAMIEAGSLDHAIELASRVGDVVPDVEIEVGLVVEPWDLGIADKPHGLPQRFLLLRKADNAFEAGAPQPAGVQRVLDEWSRDGVL